MLYYIEYMLKNILFIHFFNGSKITLSKTKYNIDSINILQKNTTLDNVDGDHYDLIILGGGKPGLPKASQAYRYSPSLYRFQRDTKTILGICYGMELLYHFYYKKQVKLLNNRNVSRQNVIDQRYTISQKLGNVYVMLNLITNIIVPISMMESYLNI